MIQTESDFQTHAISRVGAVGLMQLLPSTARYFARKNGFHFYRKKEDLYNPYVNIVLGVGYLAYLRDRFKHSQRYLAAYNLGPTTVGKMVARNRFRLGKVTRYVHRIQRRSKGFRNLGFKQSATRLN